MHDDVGEDGCFFAIIAIVIFGFRLLLFWGCWSGVKVRCRRVKEEDKEKR